MVGRKELFPPYKEDTSRHKKKHSPKEALTLFFNSYNFIIKILGKKCKFKAKNLRGDEFMHQNPCSDMVSGTTNIVKFCKKPQEASGLTQFEIVRAIYDSGILAENELSPATKLVIIALAHHFNPKREDMFPSQKFIAKKLGISERSAERAVAELKKAGLITYETQRVNHYKFTAKFFESVKLSGKFRQNVGEDLRQIVGQTNKHEQKNNTFKKEGFYSNQPKGMEYMDLKPSNYTRDERTPENDLQTAQNYVKELSPMSQNPLIKAKLDKILKIWGAENFNIQTEMVSSQKPETQGHYLIF